MMKAITLAFLLVPVFLLVKMPVVAAAVEAKFLDELSLEEIIRWNTEFSHLQLKELYDGYLPKAKIPNPQILILSIPEQAIQLFNSQSWEMKKIISADNTHRNWHGQVFISNPLNRSVAIDIYIGLVNNSYSNLLATIMFTCQKYRGAARMNSWNSKNPITPDMMSTTPFDFIAWFSPGFRFSFDAAYFNLGIYVKVNDGMSTQPMEQKYLAELSDFFVSLFKVPAEMTGRLNLTLSGSSWDGSSASVTYDIPLGFEDFWWRVDSNQGVLNLVSETELRVDNLTSERPLELTFYAISPDGAEWYSAQVVVLPKSQELSSQVDVNTEEEDK